MKISDLTGNPKNPRTITDSKLKQLKKALFKFGDLSGVIFNRKTKHLVGGHQRKQIFDGDGIITISRKYSKPTKTGTVAEGFIELEGEKFSYREVYWEEHLEKAANIAANKGAGEWDMPQLTEWLKELSDFDLEFDMDLTMFDEDELSEMPDPIEVSSHTRERNPKEKKEKPLSPPRCKAGQVYAFGEARVVVGGDLHFWDRVINLWEKHSGDEAVLMPKTQVKQPVKQGEKHGHA